MSHTLAIVTERQFCLLDISTDSPVKGRKYLSKQFFASRSMQNRPFVVHLAMIRTMANLYNSRLTNQIRSTQNSTN